MGIASDHLENLSEMEGPLPLSNGSKYLIEIVDPLCRCEFAQNESQEKMNVPRSIFRLPWYFRMLTRHSRFYLGISCRQYASEKSLDVAVIPECNGLG
ncbi:hypothetical protein CEXT_539651 [Caerostris extrusa]|uniref:Uncharacterized protein n=1 Tax=Caerostris extrusa TaxID=172846 RepID=A0AAV4W342_CAEEX|nr:hypothetical protein CEXT_539651 [Caerostris extrusa]